MFLKFFHLLILQGFAFNTGTYNSIILSLANMRKDGLGERRKKLMPEKLPRTGYFPLKRYF